MERQHIIHLHGSTREGLEKSMLNLELGEIAIITGNIEKDEE